MKTQGVGLNLADFREMQALIKAWRKANKSGPKITVARVAALMREWQEAEEEFAQKLQRLGKSPTDWDFC